MEQDPSKQYGHGDRILVVDDDPGVLDALRTVLVQSGFRVDTASGGRAALALTAGTDYDIILCDLQMPVMNGYEVVQQIKSEPLISRIPIIAVTASSMTGDSDKALSAGFDGYIAKPIEPRTFVQQIEAFLPPTLRLATQAD